MRIYCSVFILCLLFPSLDWAGEDVVHRENASNIQSNGWHLAESTEGGFSIEVPWPFSDATLNATSPMYTIVSASPNATAYTAIFIPAGTEPGMFDKFDEDFRNPDFKTGMYKQNIYVADAEEVEEEGLKFKIHTRRLKTELGMYLLMVITQPQNERIPDIERFYSSLSYTSN